MILEEPLFSVNYMTTNESLNEQLLRKRSESRTLLVRDPAFDPEKNELELAAAYFEDAFKGFYDDRKSKQAKRPKVQQFLHNTKYFRRIFMVIYIIIGFIERPVWCFFQSCGNPSTILRGISFDINTQITLSIELCCLLFFSFEFISTYICSWYCSIKN